MTEKQEQYIKNAGVVGSIPTQENWGKTNGQKTFYVGLTKDEVAEFLLGESKRLGITVEELVARMIND